MLSLLLTAIVLFAALLGALHLRSVAAGVIGLGLALGAGFALAKRPLDGMALPRLHLVYEIDSAHAVLPGPNLPDRTAATVLSRLRRNGLDQANVQVVPTRAPSDAPSLDIFTSFGPGDPERVRASLDVIGLMQFAEIDDDVDFFEPYTTSTEVPSGVRFERENAPLGPGKTALRYYAFLPMKEGETITATWRRFDAWVVTLPVPANRRIALERVTRLDPDTDTWQDEGWRTFVVHQESVLTSSHIREAQARPDQSERSLGSWLVALEFTADGARLFEEATARLTKRRFAIMMDGIVESAPVVQTRISGGHGVITMGAGSLDEQADNAKRLEVVLRSGALPAPLTLLSDERIEPVLPPGVFRALLASASLVLAIEVALALWLAFRKSPVRRPAGVAASVRVRAGG